MLCSLSWPRLYLYNNVLPLNSRTENDSEETRGQLGWRLRGKANKQTKNQGRQAAGLETVGEEKVKSLGHRPENLAGSLMERCQELDSCVQRE